MRNWLANLIGQGTGQPLASDETNEVQGLRLELTDRDQTIASLRAELERHHRAIRASVRGRTQAQMEQWAADIAAPLAQIFTQVHLLDSGQQVRPQDMAAVARRLIAVLLDNGLVLEGQIGETISFDPNRHDPLNMNRTPKAGQPVIVRFPGVAYGGRLLRKAGVETAEASLRNHPSEPAGGH